MNLMSLRSVDKIDRAAGEYLILNSDSWIPETYQRQRYLALE